MSKTLLFLMCPVLIAGCVVPRATDFPIPRQSEPIVPFTTNLPIPQKSEPTVVVERDDFKKLTRFVAPNCAVSPDSVFLRAWRKDEADLIAYQIYIKDYYRGAWRFYNNAYDSEGTPLDVTLISRDVVSCRGPNCSFEEHLGLNVSRKYLETHEQAGIQLKIYGKAGQETFVLPGGYISDFLDRIDETTSSNIALSEGGTPEHARAPSPELITAVGIAYVPDSYVGTSMARQVTINAATNDAKRKLLHKVRTLQLSNGARLIDSVDTNRWETIEQTVLSDSDTVKTRYLSDGSIEITLSIPRSTIDTITNSQ